MSARISVFLLFSLVVTLPVQAKDKKKQVLPDYVLKAQTLLVVIQPEAGEPVANPNANRIAQENVEKALTEWGRFRLVTESRTADLIVAVRKGHGSGPTIRNSPADSRPVILQPGDGNIRIGGQHGQPPDLTNPGLGPANRGPQIGNEIGPSEDTFAVYRGGIEYPLDAPAVWRYTGKDALNGPRVPAVEKFRKALAESEKQHQQKP
jgi:hypothetical protein